MDESTEGVTLYAGFINDILDMFRDKPSDLNHLMAYVEGADLSKRTNMVPITVYNNMCAYILNEIGPANTRVLGTRLGESIYDIFVNQNMVPANPTPFHILQALVDICHVAIHDPKQRGYEIVEQSNGRIIIRRTQTFNRIVQLGILSGLMNKTKVPLARVHFHKEITNGDSFDEYLITWMA